MVESVCESVIYTENICVMGREHAEPVYRCGLVRALQLARDIPRGNWKHCLMMGGW